MKAFIAQIRGLYARAVRATSALESPFLLGVRLYWGWQLTQSGWGKLHNLPKVAEFFTSLNLPMPAQTAVFISCVEFFGGILLILGLLARLNALVLTVNMLTAYVTADREALLSFLSDPDKFSAAAPYVFLIASVIILIFGPGYFSLDTLLLRRYPYPNNTAR
jgi:putative oxidoreductase